MRLLASMVFMLMVHVCLCDRWNYVSCNEVGFRRDVLGASRSSCETTKVKQMNDDFVAEDAIKLGLSVATHFVTSSFIKTAFTFTSYFISGGDSSMQTALDDQFNKLTQCIDYKINQYRSDSVEKEWRSLMTRFGDVIKRMKAGDTKEELHGRMKDLFHKINDRIEVDFGGGAEDISKYLEYEALLPIARIAAEVYWLTGIAFIAYDRELLGDNPAQGDINGFHFEIQLFREKLKKLYDWANGAYVCTAYMYTTFLWVESVQNCDGGYCEPFYDAYFYSEALVPRSPKVVRCDYITLFIADTATKESISKQHYDEMVSWQEGLKKNYVTVVKTMYDNSLLIPQYNGETLPFYDVTPEVKYEYRVHIAVFVALCSVFFIVWICCIMSKIYNTKKGYQSVGKDVTDSDIESN